MNEQSFGEKSQLDKGMSAEHFDLIVAAIFNAKYSLACILMVPFRGDEPDDYIPNGTYNRLIKENLKLEKRKPARVQHGGCSQELVGKSFGFSKELETTTRSFEEIS